MIREYIEITRFFNMGLTGVAPVLGVLSMWTLAAPDPWTLLVLFVIGCLSHAYGFVLNDIIDINIDKLSIELTRRPLVSGHITSRCAAVFAFLCMAGSFVLFVVFFYNRPNFFILFCILLVAFLFATIYNIASKKYPGVDLFVAGAVFFLILFGATTVGSPTPLAWIVCCTGGLQVLFMNMINGAIKDIDHDKQGSANTIAIRLGAHVHAGVISLPLSFKTAGFLIEIARTVLVFLPFFLLLVTASVWQIALLVVFVVLTFVFIYRLFSIKVFQRNRIRKMIGIIVICMYATTPVMLSSINVSIMLVALIPPLWFFTTNLMLHKTVFEPKTM